MKLKQMISILLTLSCLLTLFPLTAGASPQDTKTTGGKLIALTFDDGPSYYTSGLLDGLAERGVRATFFMLGQCARNYPDTVRRAFEEGHEIAQHTYDHPALTTKTNEQIQWQLEYTDEILDDCLGMNLDYLLRPPYGDQNSRVLSVIGCPAIIWSVDSCDWVSLNQYSVRDTIVNNAFDGAIVLVHDIHRSSIPGALMAVDILLEQGYEFVTVSELYRRRGVSLEDGMKYYSCKPTGTDQGTLSTPLISTRMIPGGYEVTMHSKQGAPIYYSTDGSFPTIEYKGPIVVTKDTQFQAVAAFGLNRDRSQIASANVVIKMLNVPRLYSSEGCFCFAEPGEGICIRYTADGSAVGVNSPLYVDKIPWFTGAINSFCIGDGGVSAPVTHYVSENGNIFRDVSPDTWYFDEIDRAVSLGLLMGQGNDYYAPDEELTRAAFVTLLYRLVKTIGYNTGGSTQPGFTDVEENVWYYDAASWAAEQGILQGYPDGTMRPDAPITREQMCVMLDRLLTCLGIPLPEPEPNFTDREQISPWAYSSVGRMAGAELIYGLGNGSFAPASTATRAEAGAVLLRVYDRV